MKVIYDVTYLKGYRTVSCECPERISSILKTLKGTYELVNPDKTSEKDLELIHSTDHIQSVKKYPDIYEAALYAARGALKAAEISLDEPAFGVMRPPGHHASRDTAWGFCFFNNMAFALKLLKEKSLIEKALVLDIDLHFGDGTVNILRKEPWVSIYNTDTEDREEFVEEIETVLEDREYDIVGVSAGFDTYVKDWGGILETEDYFTIGKLVKNHCEKRFALLEGGYYIPDLGLNVRAFIGGFD
ncbi:MAG: histone deacetylase family protein [Theionarchaea archaeon]|nr:histone deacetylase family protein [Theionarchaea archaeon]